MWFDVRFSKDIAVSKKFDNFSVSCNIIAVFIVELYSCCTHDMSRYLSQRKQHLKSQAAQQAGYATTTPCCRLLWLVIGQLDTPVYSTYNMPLA